MRENNQTLLDYSKITGRDNKRIIGSGENTKQQLTNLLGSIGKPGMDIGIMLNIDKEDEFIEAGTILGHGPTKSPFFF